MTAHQLAEQVRAAAQRIRCTPHKAFRCSTCHYIEERERPFREALRSLFEAVPGGSWRE